MANTTKIVLSGYYGFDNIGDEAVLYSIIAALKNEIKDVQLTVLSNNPDKTKALYGVESVNRWKIKDVARVIKESDLLVSGGGSLLQDVTSSKTVPYYLAIVKLAQIYKKKVVFYSQGIGPVNKSSSRFLIKHIVNKVDGIFVRDEGSKRLLESLGITKPVSLAIDPVLGINIAAKKVQKDHKKVGIYIRPWLDEAHDKNMIESLTTSLVQLLKEGYQLYFIPMHYNQDLAISKALAKEVQNMSISKEILNQNQVSEWIHVVDKNLSIKEVLAFTMSFDMVIGMRLHSLIMAAACGVPMLGLSYDPKVIAFMNEMDIPYCIDTTKLTEQSFHNMLERLSMHKEEQASHLESELAKKRERIYLPAHYIRQLVQH